MMFNKFYNIIDDEMKKLEDKDSNENEDNNNLDS